MSEIEKRIHARIQLSVQARVSGPGGVVLGTLKDISKGGLGVYLPKQIAKEGDQLEIFFDLPNLNEIAVMGEVLRCFKTPLGFLYGLRFSLIEPAIEKKLMSIIESCLNVAGSKTRKHPRIVKKFPVTYGTPLEFKAMLENISMGGLSMVVQKPMVLYEEIDIAIGFPNGGESIIVRGSICYQVPVEEMGTKQYRLGIEFKSMSPIAKTCIESLLKGLLEIK